jgi:hypothetical protein
VIDLLINKTQFASNVFRPKKKYSVSGQFVCPELTWRRCFFSFFPPKGTLFVEMVSTFPVSISAYIDFFA